MFSFLFTNKKKSSAVVSKREEPFPSRIWAKTRIKKNTIIWNRNSKYKFRGNRKLHI